MTEVKIKDVEPDITPEEEQAILDIGGDPGDYEAARALYRYADIIRAERDEELVAAAREALEWYDVILTRKLTERDAEEISEARDALVALVKE